MDGVYLGLGGLRRISLVELEVTKIIAGCRLSKALSWYYDFEMGIFNQNLFHPKLEIHLSSIWNMLPGSDTIPIIHYLF